MKVNPGLYLSKSTSSITSKAKSYEKWMPRKQWQPISAVLRGWRSHWNQLMYIKDVTETNNYHSQFQWWNPVQGLPLINSQRAIFSQACKTILSSRLSLQLTYIKRALTSVASPKTLKYSEKGLMMTLLTISSTSSWAVRCKEWRIRDIHNSSSSIWHDQWWVTHSRLRLKPSTVSEAKLIAFNPTKEM